MSVAILGCGPAGLLAAHAATSLGHRDVDIISIRQKSVMPGAQYLHEAIPQTPFVEPDGMLRYIKTGERDAYAQKVYGDPDVPCSWDKFEEGEVPAWSMRTMYDWLWDEYRDLIDHTAISDGELDSLERNGYELVMSTIPAPLLCRHREEHEFVSADVFITEQSVSGLMENTIVYNGHWDDDWYRSSLIFGYGSTESTRELPGSREGRKPVGTDCTCRSRIHRIGRFGKWQKGVLVHDAYRDAVKLVATKAGVKPI